MRNLLRGNADPMGQSRQFRPRMDPQPICHNSGPGDGGPHGNILGRMTSEYSMPVFEIGPTDGRGIAEIGSQQVESYEKTPAEKREGPGNIGNDALRAPQAVQENPGKPAYTDETEPSGSKSPNWETHVSASIKACNAHIDTEEPNSTEDPNKETGATKVRCRVAKKFHEDAAKREEVRSLWVGPKNSNMADNTRMGEICCPFVEGCDTHKGRRCKIEFRESASDFKCPSGQPCPKYRCGSYDYTYPFTNRTYACPIDDVKSTQAPKMKAWPIAAANWDLDPEKSVRIDGEEPNSPEGPNEGTNVTRHAKWSCKGNRCGSHDRAYVGPIDDIKSTQTSEMKAWPIVVTSRDLKNVLLAPGADCPNGSVPRSPYS